MTTTIFNITKPQMVDLFLDCFEFLKLDSVQYQKFLDIYGKPFDILSFTLDDYLYKTDGPLKTNRRPDDSLLLDVGEGWHFYFSIYECPHCYMDIVLNYDNNFFTYFHPNIDINTGKYVPHSRDKDMSAYLWNQGFSRIKTNVAKLLRANARYMADKQKYDNLQKILEIKLKA